MKRIITFAIMALLIGGFTVSANAQRKTKQQVEKDVSDFEAAVSKCETITESNEKNVNLVEKAKSKKETVELDRRSYGLSAEQITRYEKASKTLDEIINKYFVTATSERPSYEVPDLSGANHQTEKTKVERPKSTSQKNTSNQKKTTNKTTRRKKL